MKLANIITLGRLVLVVVAVVLMAVHPNTGRASWSLDWVVFGCLFTAAVTDFVDGWVARRFEQVSLVGRILDPFADKVMICAALIMFREFPELRAWVPGWIVVVVVSREFLVQSIRAVAEAQGVEFGADAFGKWKMVTQCVYVLGLSAWFAGWDWPIEVVRYAVWLMIVFTVGSGLNYVRKAWRVLEF